MQRSTVWDANHVRLQDGNQKIATKNRLLSTFSDGSAQYVLLDANDKEDFGNQPTYVLDSGELTKDSGRMANGWIGAQGSKASVAIGVRDFADLFPGSVELHNPTNKSPKLIFGFWSDHGEFVLHTGKTALPQYTSGKAVSHETTIMLASGKTLLKRLPNLIPPTEVLTHKSFPSVILNTYLTMSTPSISSHPITLKLIRAQKLSLQN